MSQWTIYWILMLDNVCILEWVFTVLAFLFLVLVVATRVGDAAPEPSLKDKAREQKDLRSLTRIAVAVLIGLALLLTFTPSTRQMAAVVVVPRLYEGISGNPEVMKIPEKLIDLANKWIDELQPEPRDNEAAE